MTEEVFGAIALIAVTLGLISAAWFAAVHLVEQVNDFIIETRKKPEKRGEINSTSAWLGGVIRTILDLRKNKNQDVFRRLSAEYARMVREESEAIRTEFDAAEAAREKAYSDRIERERREREQAKQRDSGRREYEKQQYEEEETGSGHGRTANMRDSPVELGGN